MLQVWALLKRGCGLWRRRCAACEGGMGGNPEGCAACLEVRADEQTFAL
jgi:hypothetical protein